MDFKINDEQNEICKAIEELSTKRLNENIFLDDEQEVFSRKKWEQCGEMGILSLPVPEMYGGLDASMLTTALAIQSLARSCMDEGLVFAICAHLCTCVIPIMLVGTREQKRFYLGDLASGKKVGGNGSSESNAGSDMPSLKTTVIKRDDGFKLNGAKIFVSNGTIADLFIMYAKHPKGMRMTDISAFIVEKDNKGIEIGQIFKKMGLRTCPLCEIVLNECEIPMENLLGRERFGMVVFNQSMLWERIIMAAYHVGAMEQQFTNVVKHATNRKQFGKRIIDNQDISSKIVTMKMNIELTKLLLYKTSSDYDNGQVSMGQASMLKLHAAESKVNNSLNAVQIYGAYGYLKEYMAEKQLRDSIAAPIYSGTSEIQKRIITEEIIANA